jgi:hypothetical protein
MHPYDAILGFDWLQTHSPMEYDWKNKTLQFSEKGKLIKLQGLTEPTMQLSSMLATKVYNATKGNDVWPFQQQQQLSLQHNLSSPICYNLSKMSSLTPKYFHQQELMTMPFH